MLSKKDKQQITKDLVRHELLDEVYRLTVENDIKELEKAKKRFQDKLNEIRKKGGMDTTKFNWSFPQ